MFSEHVVERTRELVAGGLRGEDLLGYLRGVGLDESDSTAVLSEICDLSAREADEVVSASETWADRRAERQHVRERLWALVTEWADEVRELPDGRVELTFDPDRREPPGG